MSLPPSLLLNRTFVVLILGLLFFEIELSTSCKRLLMSLSFTAGTGSSGAPFTPDNLALARANTSYGDPPGELLSDEMEGLGSLSSEFNRRIVEPWCGCRFVGVSSLAEYPGGGPTPSGEYG